jgi:hypothetical protein
MFAHVPKDIESRHGFHSNVGDDDMRLNGIHLFDGFGRSVERENLVTFFPTKGDDDFDHRRLVIDDYDFSHSQRGEYFSFEKKKEKMRKKLRRQVISPWSMIHGTLPTKLRIVSKTLADFINGRAIISAKKLAQIFPSSSRRPKAQAGFIVTISKTFCG